MTQSVTMRESPRDRFRFRKGKHPGFIRTVVAGFLILTAANAVGFYGLAVYLGSLEASGKFPLELVSGMTSVFFLVSGFAGLAVGRGLTFLSVRTILVAGAVATGGGVWLVGHAAASWQLLCAYTLLGAGMSLTGPITLTTALIRAVPAGSRRNQAMAVMLSGMTAGGAIFVPILAGAVERHGLPATTALAAPLAALAIAVPTLLVAHSRPVKATAGERPGEQVVPPEEAEAQVDVGRPEGRSEGDKVRTPPRWPRAGLRTFLLLSLTFSGFLGSQVGFNTQLYTIATEFDIPGAGGALGVVAGTGMVARVLGILLVRWVPPERFLCGMAVSQSLSALVLLLFNDKVGLYAAACLLGMAVGNASVLSPILTLKFFGHTVYSRVLSRLSFIQTLGIASGPMVAGGVRSLVGSYHVVLIGVTVLSFLVACSCLVLERRGRRLPPEE